MIGSITYPPSPETGTHGRTNHPAAKVDSPTNRKAATQALPAGREPNIDELTGIELVDTATGEVLHTDALLVHIRVSKSDVTARGSITRILAQDDEELCPVRAFRAWRAVLVDHDQPLTGPLIRRIDKHGRIGAAPGCRWLEPPASRSRSGAARRWSARFSCSGSSGPFPPPNEPS
ncbi:hypothetical protein [Embleya hyalina]|uniref:hypothetical protein n=1 Tax=Embleya hyalina TaxID=516124 RepID=UPI000F839367|nr:hypothetical protein [Embleya hyalina]